MTTVAKPVTPFTTTGSGETLATTHSSLGSKATTVHIHLMESTRRGTTKVGSAIKGSGLYIAKRGSDNITSASVTMRANLIPSYRLA